MGEYEKGHILGDEPSTVFPHSPPEWKQHAKIYLWIVTIQIPAFQLILFGGEEERTRAIFLL
jgi:hypothetical protein